jgi:molecular chaperone GrpE
MTSPEEMGNGLVIRDRRRIDPVTGQVRQPGEQRGEHAAPRDGASPAAGREEGTREPGPAESATADAGPGRPASAAVSGEEAAALREQLAERTADLQRVQAEYANYRKRVDRDRVAVREFALFGVLTDLLPVLDAIGRARQHEELSGGFKSVAESLEFAVAKLGLVAYGEKGDPFDPKIHEALTHMYSPDVTEVTCVEILQPGYKVGERILRPARVAVAEPATGPDGIAESPAAASRGAGEPGDAGEPGNAEGPEIPGPRPASQDRKEASARRGQGQG